jgi:rfaE bifunctional protein kinase chain/domain
MNQASHKKYKTAFISGNFNILHPGHLRLFKYAKECAEVLIVGVKSDRISFNTAIIKEKDRLDCVQNNILVDKAFIIDENISKIIEKIKPDIILKGKEHENKENEEDQIIKKYGGKLLFSSGDSSFSSLDLLESEFINNKKIIEIPEEYLKRHNITTKNLINIINKFKKLNICVIGDLIVDEYIYCEPLGMSHEDPTIVVSPLNSIKFIGGAGIVAAHASGLGAKVDFFSISGKDTTRNFAMKTLNEANVNCHVLIDNSRPTTLKQRFRTKAKTHLRVSNLRQGEISTLLQNKLLNKIKKFINDANVIIFSDFNYGVLSQDLIDKILLLTTKNKNIIIAADSQSSSQIGDISRYKNFNLITPTEHEARISTKNKKDGLVVLVEQLRKLSFAEHILLKLGEEGLLIHSYKNNNLITDKIHALNISPQDPAGAGDSLLVASTLTLACKGSIWEAACLGSVAAAIQVGRIGNQPLTSLELKKILQNN